MRKLPEPGYYRSGDKDVLVIDPLKLSDEGEVVTKDGDAGNWRPAVVFKQALVPGSRTYVLSADVFDGRFKPTTEEEVRARVADRERKESLDAAVAAGDFPAPESEEDEA